VVATRARLGCAALPGAAGAAGGRALLPAGARLPAGQVLGLGIRGRRGGRGRGVRLRLACDAVGHAPCDNVTSDVIQRHRGGALVVEEARRGCGCVNRVPHIGEREEATAVGVDAQLEAFLFVKSFLSLEVSARVLATLTRKRIDAQLSRFGAGLTFQAVPNALESRLIVPGA